MIRARIARCRFLKYGGIYASERERRTVHDVDGGGGDEKIKHSEGTTYRRDEVAIQKKACLLEQVHNELGARRRFRTPL